ncbi:MAG TPA: phosphonate ABC transporter, permease protein PhnE [Anaerolineales bacterium]|nr:phosphonate ABC transporter, permease protein PhnE [Anaerolineales bacterium]
MKTRPSVWRISLTILLIALAVLLLGASARISQIDFVRLFVDAPKAKNLVTAFLTPDLVTRGLKTTTIEMAFPIPCGSAPNAVPVTSGPHLSTSVPCAAVKDTFTLNGYGLAPNAQVAIRWNIPKLGKLTLPYVNTDANGNFTAKLDAKQIAASKDNTASLLQVDTMVPEGGWKVSQAVKDVLQAMFVTIFMALLSTSVATAIAVPLSFLAASNITRHGPVGTAVYYITRSFFNIIRSYDPLVMATVFAFWLGFGPFPGALALTVVTTASLGKMFSEAVENIEPGPIEALQATGANRLQTVVYSVIPQIIPDFVSYIIYHWDINVRISTVIGFVGGGGIGYYLSTQINSMIGYHKAGTAIWAIVAVVWAMDFLSAEVRKRLA